MRQNSSSARSIDRPHAYAVTETAEQYGLKRGLWNGVVLSMAVWTAVLYLTLVTR